MTDQEINNRENGVRKLGDPSEANGQEAGRTDAAEGGRADQPDDAGEDTTRHDAVREAQRLGATDVYLVDQDMEDIGEREDQDGPDGRPSPLANADNAER